MLKKMNDIRKFLNKNGFFYKKEGKRLKAHVKTGESFNDIRELFPVEEARLKQIILNTLVNPLILIEEINLREIATIIDFKTVKDFNKREKENNDLKECKKQLKSCNYIFIKDTCQYYKIQDSKIRKSGIFNISHELIPEDEIIKSFDNYNTVMKAFKFNKSSNKYKSDYERESKKFDSLGVCKW